MRFSNAYKGIKIIFVGEIIGVLLMVCLEFPSTILQIFTSLFSESGMFEFAVSSVVTNLMTYASQFFELLSFVVVMIGSIIASKDEKKYREAAIVIAITIIGSMVKMFIDIDINMILEIVIGVLGLWAVVAVLQGCINISDSCKEEDISEKGVKALKIVIFAYTASIILTLSTQFFMSRVSLLVIGVIIIIMGTIVQITAYVFYIVHLSRMKKMLKVKQLQE